MDNIKFSITIPSYKAHYLHEAIDSVLNQTYHNFELIIVDDCSPENLKTVIDKFNDSRICYYRNENNCGALNVVDNWNICLNYCTGDYVICMGDDDRLLPCCLQELHELIYKYPDLDVYHVQTQIINEQSQVIINLEPRPEFETCNQMLLKRFHGRLQYIGDFCYKVDALRKHEGYYKLPLGWNSDDITAYRASLNKGIANTITPCFQYRDNTLSISNGSMDTYKIDALQNAEEWYQQNIISNGEAKGCINELESAMQMRFQKLYCQHISSILKNDHSLIFKYFADRDRYHLNLRMIFKIWIKSII